MSAAKTWTYTPPDCTCPEGATEHEDACPVLDIATFTIEYIKPDPYRELDADEEAAEEATWD